MAKKRRHRRIKLAHLLAICAPGVGVLGLASCLGLTGLAAGSKALACGITALLLGVYVLIDMQIKRRHNIWSTFLVECLGPANP